MACPCSCTQRRTRRPNVPLTSSKKSPFPVFSRSPLRSPLAAASQVNVPAYRTPQFNPRKQLLRCLRFRFRGCFRAFYNCHQRSNIFFDDSFRRNFFHLYTSQAKFPEIVRCSQPSTKRSIRSSAAPRMDVGGMAVSFNLFNPSSAAARAALNS